MPVAFFSPSNPKHTPAVNLRSDAHARLLRLPVSMVVAWVIEVPHDNFLPKAQPTFELLPALWAIPKRNRLDHPLFPLNVPVRDVREVDIVLPCFIEKEW